MPGSVLASVTWCCGTRFTGHGDVGLVVGLSDPEGLLQLKQFCDSVS